MVQLDRFGDEAPARRSSRDETSSSLQGRASRLQQRVTVLEVDLAQAQSQINSLKQQLAVANAETKSARAAAGSLKQQLAAAHAAAAAPAAAPAADEEAPRFRVGDTVDVAPRTFPGINKAGGTGTITKVNDERSKDGGPMKDGSDARTTGFTYAVKYTISGSEKRVDAQWIARIDEEEEDGSDGGAAETLRTPGGRVATVLERRARGWIYVELDGNANDEGGAHERKSFRNSQLSK